MFFNNLVFSLYVRLKFLLSFRRKTWTLRDYPIRFSFTPEDAVPPRPDLIRVPWSASVYGWFQVGTGDTKTEALAQLQQSFDAYLESGKPLPRPGTVAPFFFDRCAADEIEKYRHLWDEFLDHICDVEAVFFLSDSSSLSDFIFTDHTREEQNRLVALRYSVDISDIEDGNLLRIFERIEAHRRV